MLPIVYQVFLEKQRRRENLALIRERRLLQRNSDPFLLVDKRFIELFRLNKVLVRELIDTLRSHLHQRQDFRGISIDNMVLCALRFYATSLYQRCVGQEYIFGMAQSTIHKYVHIITSLMIDHVVGIKIKFPTENEQDIIKLWFLNRWRFPSTVGAIDGTHCKTKNENVINAVTGHNATTEYNATDTHYICLGSSSNDFKNRQ